MSDSTMKLMKGMAMGAMLGMTAGVIGTKMMESNKKTMKRKANKALHTVENMIDTASYMFK
ncbi:MAG: hypothetical protein Q4D44_00180 [Eubacteriales bacterium]|nr:hypothetical protein [Eubacteriales bacterium]